MRLGGRKDRLHIGCASGRPDELDFLSTGDTLLARITADVHDKHQRSETITITHEDARRLFNWLGVWLHRP